MIGGTIFDPSQSAHLRKMATANPSTTPILPDLRGDFPGLDLEVRPGVRLTYLDNAATTHKPWSVIRAIQAYDTEYPANVHRGIHTMSERATEAFELCSGEGGSIHQRRRGRGDHLDPRDNRLDQSGRAILGPHFSERGRRDRSERSGASFEPRSLADARQGTQPRAPIRRDHRRRSAGTRGCRAAAFRPHAYRRHFRDVQRARNDRPPGPDRGHGP